MITELQRIEGLERDLRTANERIDRCAREMLDLIGRMQQLEARQTQSKEPDIRKGAEA